MTGEQEKTGEAPAVFISSCYISYQVNKENQQKTWISPLLNLEPSDCIIETPTTCEKHYKYNSSCQSRPLNSSSFSFKFLYIIPSKQKKNNGQN